MRSSLVIVCAAFGLCFGANKPTVVIRNLSGSGIDSTTRSALSSRLSTELFGIDSFSIVSPRVGKINQKYQYEIEGSIDKVGSMYSATIRMVDMATDAVFRTVSTDCTGCSIENVYAVLIPRAASMISGVKTPEAVQPLPPLRTVSGIVPEITRTEPYKDDSTAESWAIAVFAVPESAEVQLDEEDYGRGSVIITGVPEGWHELESSYDPGHLKNTLRTKERFLMVDGNMLFIAAPKKPRVSFRVTTGYEVSYINPEYSFDSVPGLWGSAVSYRNLRFDQQTVKSLALAVSLKVNRSIFTLSGTPVSNYDETYNGQKYGRRSGDTIVTYNPGAFLEYAFQFRPLNTNLFQLSLEPGIFAGYTNYFRSLSFESWKNVDSLLKPNMSRYSFEHARLGGLKFGIGARLTRMIITFDYRLGVDWLNCSVDRSDYSIYSNYSHSFETFAVEGYSSHDERWMLSHSLRICIGFANFP